jgi:hypothetical protein
LTDLQYLSSNYTTTTGLTTLLSSYVLSSNLASYSTTTQMDAAITTALAPYTNTAGINTLLSAYTNTAGINTLLSAYTNTAGMTTLLNAKQDTLTAGANITISNNTISATGGETQAWVTANFLSPLNSGTVGVMQGLPSTMTANTFIISVDGNTDSRTKFILRDSGNTARHITANTSGKILFDSAPLATEAHLTTQLATKQDALTASTGVFLNGATLTGYDLRWNTNSTPTGTIQCLRFEDLTVTSNGQLELKVEHPASHAISMITGLQTELNKISGLKTGTSGLSMGGHVGPLSGNRIADHEVEIGDPNYTAGTYMYGMGLYVGNTVGTAFWGSTAALLPDQGSGTGAAFNCSSKTIHM